MTVGSLFAGIGGFDLAAERVGWEVKWQVEIDPFCRRVLEKNWPHVRRYEDVREVHGKDSHGRPNLIARRLCDQCLEPVDVICGGFPCQDISPAGSREGIDGPQSGLWREYHRLVCELRPRYVVVENSADLLVRGMERVLGDLAASGYDAEWECLPAFAFGAPHRRDRVFLVAYPERGGLQGGILQRAEPPADLAAARHRGRFGHQHGAAWEPEPDVALLDDGLPRDLVAASIHAVGNTIVPAIAEWIFRRIQEAEGVTA